MRLFSVSINGLCSAGTDLRLSYGNGFSRNGFSGANRA